MQERKQIGIPDVRSLEKSIGAYASRERTLSERSKHAVDLVSGMYDSIPYVFQFIFKRIMVCEIDLILLLREQSQRSSLLTHPLVGIVLPEDETVLAS